MKPLLLLGYVNSAYLFRKTSKFQNSSKISEFWHYLLAITE